MAKITEKTVLSVMTRRWTGESKIVDKLYEKCNRISIDDLHDFERVKANLLKTGQIERRDSRSKSYAGDIFMLRKADPGKAIKIWESGYGSPQLTRKEITLASSFKDREKLVFETSHILSDNKENIIIVIDKDSALELAQSIFDFYAFRTVLE